LLSPTNRRGTSRNDEIAGWREWTGVDPGHSTRWMTTYRGIGALGWVDIASVLLVKLPTLFPAISTFKKVAVFVIAKRDLKPSEVIRHLKATNHNAPRQDKEGDPWT
jgi:hypothetical protein